MSQFLVFIDEGLQVEHPQIGLAQAWRSGDDVFTRGQVDLGDRPTLPSYTTFESRSGRE